MSEIKKNQKIRDSIEFWPNPKLKTKFLGG
jgi:hypothetical protein